MTERIRIEVDDAELDAVIARIDEAILKKVELLTGVPKAAPDIPVAPKISGEMAIVVKRLKADLIDLEDMAEVTEVNVEVITERVWAEILAVKQEADFVSRDALMKLLAVEKQTKTIKEQIRDLPNIDRATRMILLRVPGLREALRLLYIVKMEERTLRLGQVVAKAKAAEIDIGVTIAKLSGELTAVSAEVVAFEVVSTASINRVVAEMQAAEAQAVATVASFRGPITVGVTLIMYALMAVQGVQRQQERIEARLDAIERERDQRYITMEEAVRGYGALHERYRSTIRP